MEIYNKELMYNNLYTLFAHLNYGDWTLLYACGDSGYVVLTDCWAYLLTIRGVYRDIGSVVNAFYRDESVVRLYQNGASSYLSHTVLGEASIQQRVAVATSELS